MKQTKFKKDKYRVLRGVITKDVANFLLHYLVMKRTVAKTLHNMNGGEQGMSGTGTFLDQQVPGAYSLYGDPAFDTLLNATSGVMKKLLGENVYPTYSYARLYTMGNDLKRHKDRPSCEISTTVNLGGDPWPIFIEPSGKINKKGKKVILKPGDMLFYFGCKLEHWREPFKGKVCGQAFLHYSTNESLKFDDRLHLGLPK
jgi:hypothetical protein|tara:strand:+ start:286 stop:885 length:600 start_codon:yes stop_codon:yes gene_type:complete